MGSRGLPVGKTLFNNCTETVLAGAATYTGEWVNVEDYPSVVAVAKSDVALESKPDWAY